MGKLQTQEFHTYDGYLVPPRAPSVRTVAMCLCRESRYCGNGELWWNVGLHSFVVADLLPDKLKLHGLLHDQPECITGDTPHTLKTKRQRLFEDMLLERFYAQHDLTLPTKEEHKEIKTADRTAVHGEVWAGCGTHCLATKYDNIPEVCDLVTKYSRAYTYADCLERDGKAVLEFCRRFVYYKSLL